MGHARRVLGQRFGAAQTDRQVKKLQRIEETKRLPFASDNVEGDHAPRRQALLAIDGEIGLIFRQMAQVVDPLDLGMIGQIVGHVACVLHLRGHAQFERLQAAQQQPAGQRR